MAINQPQKLKHPEYPRVPIWAPFYFLSMIFFFLLLLARRNLFVRCDLKTVKIITGNEDVVLLQSHLNRLVQWCQYNKMHLNPKIFYYVTFSRKRQKNLMKYCIDQEQMKEVDTIRDLFFFFWVRG